MPLIYLANAMAKYERKALYIVIPNHHGLIKWHLKKQINNECNQTRIPQTNKFRLGFY